jgi:hypothetical protein
VVSRAEDSEDQLLEDLEDVDLNEIEVRSELRLHILNIKTVMRMLCGMYNAYLTLWFCLC